MRDARAHTAVIKAREEARSLIEARSAQIARVAREADEARMQQEEARKRAEQQQRREEHVRTLEALKEYGRSIAIQEGLPAEWRSRVTKDLEDYVSPARFPMSLADHERREYVRARVAAIASRYLAKQAEEAEKLHRQAELERQQGEMRNLIELGKKKVEIATLSWDPRDAERARRDVARSLADQIEPDWTRSDVEGVVREELADWVEDGGEDGDEDGDDEEDPEDDPGEGDSWF